MQFIFDLTHLLSIFTSYANNCNFLFTFINLCVSGKPKVLIIQFLSQEATKLGGPSDKTSKSEASCFIMCGTPKIFLVDCVFDLKVFKTFHMSLVGINRLKYYLIISNLLAAAEVQSVTPLTSYAEDQMFDSQPQQTVVYSGSDSLTAKRLF